MTELHCDVEVSQDRGLAVRLLEVRGRVSGVPIFVINFQRKLTVEAEAARQLA